MSGPLLDRIDIQLRVPAVRATELSGDGAEEPSVVIQRRVELARERQRVRFAELASVHANAHMGAREIRRFCKLGSAAEDLLRTAMSRLGLSARAYHRILKVARTIADLQQAEEIAPPHVAEAIQYRTLDRSRTSA